MEARHPASAPTPAASGDWRTEPPLWLVALLLALIVGAGLFYFPGTQYLTSDTQIYTPMLEHSRDARVLARDPLVQYPHLGLSLYDEIVNGVRDLTGLPAYPVMYACQVLFRIVLVLAGYLLALGICHGRWESLWAAAVLQATGFVAGPSVMVVEYDAVPRGFTLAISLLATACLLYGRAWLAALLAAVGLFFQAGAAYPFLACFGLYLLLERRDEAFLYRLRFLLPMVASLGLILLSAGLHGGGSASLSLVPDWLRELHHLRASYNYPSLWHPAVLWTPVGLGCVCLAAGWVLSPSLPRHFQWYLLGVPVAGMISIPFAWLFMEQFQVFLMAQLQPARALAFLYAFGVPVLLALGVRMARHGRWVAAWFWFLAGFSIPFSNQLVFFVGANGWPASRFRYLWVPALACVALLVFWLWKRARVAAVVLLCVLAAAPFGILREVLGTNAFATDARSAEIAELAAWAKAHTGSDAVFAFPGFGKGSQPGVFRSQALRAVYTDWKSGGQVNFSQDFARLWWERWNAVMTAKTFSLEEAVRFQSMQIDYVVVPPAQAPAGIEPLFRNGAFAAYAVDSLVRAQQADASRP